MSGISFTTLAYYSDSKISTKKFASELDVDGSQGGIKIKIEEPAWDVMSLKLDSKVLLKPGAIYAKDPRVTVLKENTGAFVFMSVDHNLYDANKNLLEDIVVSAEWAQVNIFALSPEQKAKHPNKRVYVYIGNKGLEVDSLKDHRYIPTSNVDVELEPLFTEIKAITDFGDGVLSSGVSFEFNVEAYAHQAVIENHTIASSVVSDLIVPATSGALAHFFGE